MSERDRVKQKGPRCGIENCRSRLYEEGEDGFLYCQNGHQKGGLVVGEDEGDFNTARRTTTRKKKDDDEFEAHDKYLRGKPGVDIYLKALQLILRHQTHYLIHTQHLPQELESVVLDLWTLRILQLENQVSHGPGADSQSQYTASSGDESEASAKEDKIWGSRGQKKKLETRPGLVDTLALCYLGCVTLRLPVTPGDILSWIVSGEMPYKNAIRLLPVSMKEKMTHTRRMIFNPNTLLTPERFIANISDLRIAMQLEHGIQWPRLNHPLLLFRLLKDLALPLELYDATIRLATILNYNFALPTSESEKSTRLGVRHLPEAQILACLTIAVKLIYPFQLPSNIKAPTSPTTPMIDWQTWTKQIPHLGPRTTTGDALYTTAQLTKIQEKDVFSMSGAQMDQYMDFYLDAFIDPAEQKGGENDTPFRKALYEFFPGERQVDTQTPIVQEVRALPTSQKDKLEVVRAVHASMRPPHRSGRGGGEDDMEIDGDGAGRVKKNRPGSQYPIWRSVDELPELARRFYEESAKIEGLSIEMLVSAVFFAEKQVERWEKARRRGQTQ